MTLAVVVLEPLQPGPSPVLKKGCAQEHQLNSGQNMWLYFSKGKVQMASRYIKRCSTSLIIRGMQVKTTVRYHLTPVSIAIIKITRNKKCW